MPAYIRTRSEFAVNSYTAQSQTAPSVATFADGGFVVVWGTGDPAQDGSSSSIKAQLFDSAGRKTGPEFLVNTSGAGNQFTASVAASSDGSFLVSWVTNGTDGGIGDGIKAQLFGRDGEPLGGEFQLNVRPPYGSGSVFTPNVVALAGGGYVVSWDDWNGFDVKAQILDSAGVRVGGVFTVNTKTGYAEEYGDLTALAGGGFVATWRTTDSSADGSMHAVKAQLFSASGAKLGAEFLVNTQSAGYQYSPSVTALAGGGFVIAWYSTDPAQDGSEGAIKAQLFGASGAKVGGEFLVNTQAAGTQHEPVVAGLPGGGFIVAWVNLNTAQDGSGSAIKAQTFDSAGAKVGGEMLVNTLAAGAQFLPDLATLADGRVVAAWASESGDVEGYSVRAQILGTALAEPLPNTAPRIISNGGGTSASLTLDEGVFAVTTVVASDDGEPNSLRYSIIGGADAGLFAINARTGALSFIQAPDHEAPRDQGGDNFYTVMVSASDGTYSSWQSIQISIRDVNQIAIVSDGGGDYAYIALDENRTAVTTVAAFDDEGATLSYAIVGGTDSDLFTIDRQTGALSFTVAPDYESPRTYDGSNVYTVYVSASDGTVSDVQGIAVYVQDVEESSVPAVVIMSDGGGDEAVVRVAENGTAVTRVAASGASSGPVVYEIAGGADSWLFTIDPYSGVLEFRWEADFEAWSDWDRDNVYEVAVRASDGTSYDEQRLSVVLHDVDEAPVIYSYGYAEGVSLTLDENASFTATVAAWDPETRRSVTYSIAGGDDAALFAIDPATGALSFVDGWTPDFEEPADAYGRNVYEVIVAATSGGLNDWQGFAIMIRDVNEAPAIVSDGGGTDAAVSIDENERTVTTVVARDPDGTAPTYAISGGPDAARFTIDPVTGVLSFVESPDFEAPTDRAGANFYTVEVEATDGEYTSWQRIQVQVRNVNEGVTITSALGGDSAGVWITENETTVLTVAASDSDGDPVTYAISGGADAAFFTIDPQTGALRFVAAPDFETPADADGDNYYEVVVEASDSALADHQALSVRILNVVDGRTIVGTSGHDTIGAAATNAEDTIYGRDGHDTIYGHGGSDELFGDSGKDVLNGGAGADRLTGGTGADQFAYNSVSDSTPAAPDVIADFSRGHGDRIALSAIDANSAAGGNQAFTFIGSAAFSGVAGQLRYEASGGTTIVSGDVDGDGVADLQILLSGTLFLSGSDFVL